MLSSTLRMLALFFAPIAVSGYLCGCLNGAILVSHLFCKDDVRRYGSGNAGLTNFYRTYGGKYALMVIAVDMGKAFLSVALAQLWYRNGIVPLLGGEANGVLPVLLNYVAGFFCMLGHMFPAFSGFHGGKGILCSAALLLALDWRVAVVSWGLFFLVAALTRYVSLGSLAAAWVFPFTTHLIYRDTAVTAVAVLLMLFITFAHRQNIVRLCHGTENKFHRKK